MANVIIDNISLIILLPLWIFLIIMGGRFFAVYVHKTIIYLLTILSSFLGIVITSFSLTTIADTVEWSIPFIKIDNFLINLGLRIDKLSLIMALVLYLISFAIQIFSVSYMKEKKKNYRFYALINLFNFAMSGLLFSSNLFQLYVFWEIVGVVSYLLIGFDYNKQEKSCASKRVLLINRIGDTALIGGIILTSCCMYSYAQNYGFLTLEIDDLNVISTLLSAYTPSYLYVLISGLFIIGAVVKSAQFPFYSWLQDAMEAELPVSALLHSATLVVSGVYLLIRIMPFLTLNTILTKSLIVIGILTALLCSIFAFMETNNKKILAYSTSANFGLIFTALGLGNIKIALILFLAHAFIKSMMFLALPKEGKISYAELAFLIMGGLSLAGILFGGYSAKEMLYSVISNKFISGLLLVISFCTALYITRLVILIFKTNEKYSNLSKAEIFSLLILMSLNILMFIKLPQKITTIFIIAVCGLIFTCLISKNLSFIPQPPRILENLYNIIIPKIYSKFTIGAENAEKKLFRNYKWINSGTKYIVSAFNFVEKNIIEKCVIYISELIKEISTQDMIIQTKNVQTYNIYAFILVTIIITLVIVGYAYMLPIGS